MFKSRTVWTVIVMVVFNALVQAWPELKEFVPVPWYDLINAILGGLAVYFRIKPRQEF